MMEKKQQTIPVEIDEKAAEGIYSNFVLTAHTASEFILDFARMLPGTKKAKVHARVILTPQSAKSLFVVLERTIKKYEETFGEIVLPQKGLRADGQSIGFQTKLPTSADKSKETEQ
jgi:hypothetical protein